MYYPSRLYIGVSPPFEWEVLLGLAFLRSLPKLSPKSLIDPLKSSTQKGVETKLSSLVPKFTAPQAQVS
jgi:hypothetical protein